MDYPVTLKVEFPERLSRLTTFFRLFMLIPQALFYIYLHSCLGGHVSFLVGNLIYRQIPRGIFQLRCLVAALVYQSYWLCLSPDR